MLIGIKNLWHGLLVFVVSLIAILSFTSAAQGWLLVKLKWFEIIALLFVTVCMFRPDFIMNLVYPEYSHVRQDFDAEIFIEEGRKVRLHITRHTDYGERYKLFVFPIYSDSQISITDLTGLELKKSSSGSFEVSNIEFMGSAEKKGIQFFDEITAVEISSTTRPSKEYIYLLGLLVLILVYSRQRSTFSKLKSN